MSGFDLVQVDGDGGGDPIHLPPGETVLGRGPLLGVSDKRVSRLHGLLENLDGQLRLKPIHLNPCFVQLSPTDDPRPLQRNAWHPLHHGDLLSLMPGQFVFQVVAVGGEDRTPRNSQTLEKEEEEEELPVAPEPDVEPHPPAGQTPPPPAAASNREDGVDGSPNKGETARPKEVQGVQRDEPPSGTGRVLPAWMMAAVAAPPGSSSSSSSPKVQSAVKRSKGPSTSAKAAAAANQATPTKTSAPEEAELCEEEMSTKRRRVDEEEDEEEEEEEEERGRSSTADINTAARANSFSQSGNEAKKARGGGSSGASATGPRLREPCPYGRSCYRKNPAHFQECSHPDDTDYEEDEDEEEGEEEETQEADRPECPYGTDCYRKNPLHRKEYKHTKKPGRATRTAHKKADNADDADDSFIDDDSDDAGDDADYAPPVSDDSDEEDVAGLQEEAKAFVKRRK